MTVLTIIALLLGMLAPAISRTRELARRGGCMANQRSCSAALLSYATSNQFYLPPFAFSSATTPDLPLSGHWGGWDNLEEDQDMFGRDKSIPPSVNLYALVDEKHVSRKSLFCPGAAGELRDGEVSYFPYTRKFSTYCLRFPASEDLFASASDLAYWNGGALLDIYRFSAGGFSQYVPTGPTFVHQTVPFARIDSTYRRGDRSFRYPTHCVLADTFWTPQPSTPLQGSLPIRRGACHEGSYNVIRGDGSASTVEDDGTVRNQSAAAVFPLRQEEIYQRAETIWNFFDDAR